MRKFVLLALASCLAFVSFAQKKNQPAQPAPSFNEEQVYGKLKYRNIGPYRGGRSAAVAGSYKNKTTFFMGTTGGGVWKTSDGGSNWKNISDKYFGSSIGAVAVMMADAHGKILG
jgi:hypothetical protein